MESGANRIVFRTHRRVTWVTAYEISESEVNVN